MIQHLIAFSLYTFAMIGIFFIAFIVYKKTININGPKLNNGMKIEDMLRLSQRKTIYIINVQGERFLIASDLENTTFLAKLGDKNSTVSTASSMYQAGANKTKEDNSSRIEKYIKELETIDGTLGAVENISNTDEEYSNAVDLKSKNTIMKNILRELENNSKRTSI